MLCLHIKPPDGVLVLAAKGRWTRKTFGRAKSESQQAFNYAGSS